MRSRQWIWILLCLLLAAGAWFLRPQGHHPFTNPRTTPSAPPTAAAPKASPLTILSTNNVQAAAAARAKANQYRYRLSNTTRNIGELTGDPHAILLANALIDTRAALNLSIPKKMQAPGEPGAYIVQANGPIDNAFRAMLARSGAHRVSYIPNNAYLVTIAKSGADELAADGFPVIPYEPYYKVSASLLSWVGKSLPADATLNVELFPGSEKTAIPEIEAAGGKVLSQDASQNGWIVNVQPPADWTAVPALPGVHIVEPSHRRVTANDLSRARVGVAVDTQAPTNYLNLSGSNVLVEVNDSGIDATHPDFDAGGSGPVRVIGDSALSLVDTNGHGTHVAGTIAGDGTESMTVTNAQGSIMPGTNGQFRGMAPAATLYSVVALGNSGGKILSDPYLQNAPALTNALISNNSWNYGGDSAYDLAAASYDAAVRDALPQVTGSQPVLFVFSAGNEGNGDDTTDPGSGTPDSIDSPATAKNVITVGAIQEFRNITNEVTNADLTISAPWQAGTSTSYRIAGYSSRGNVGINTEGVNGRFKPDVVAPGTSIISTRSSQWDINTYFYQSPTNFSIRDFSVVIQADTLAGARFPRIPTNTVGVTIELFPNPRSPVPFPPVLPIYYALVGSPSYNYFETNAVSIPPDPPGIGAILGSEGSYGFNYAISNVTSEPINFDIVLDTITTNYPGNYFLVYSNLDQTLGTPADNPPNTGPGPYYRYETGTSMAAADVSGVLALMQDYFTNILHTTPSPALLKALLINGARPTGAYDLQVQNNINFEGWGLINLPASLPPGVTNQAGASCSSFFIDQSPTNALATGDRHTFQVTITDTNAVAQTLPLRVTLAWTDPPGDPAAAIKLVNNLDLVVTNLDDPAHPVIFYGNDIGSGSIFNTPESTNTPPNLDVINNVENVFISQPLGTNYSITVMGRDVNVNAVTAHTNNVVQDFALVIACGEGEVTNAMTVTDNGVLSAPTADQQITFANTNQVNAPLLNQFVGASTPLLGTNTVPTGTIKVLDTNGVPVGATDFATNTTVTLGMTNQWHFYVVTNNGANDQFTNAAFITFIPDTLSIPRMGVFADSTANATTPEADIDLYVTTDPTITNLNPVAISKCVNGTQIGLSAAGVFNGASLGRSGTEFVVDIGSKPGQVYYVGVKSERQMASEYGFLSVFTSTPFSQMNQNGQTVNGLLLPTTIPDGSPAHPGIAYIFALALYPMQVGQVIVSNQVVHQNFGDLIGVLNHNHIRDVLNNHDSLGNPPGPYAFLYDDSGAGNFPGSQKTDGPGSLRDFTGTEAIGPWMLAEEDTSLTQTGFVTNGFTLTIVKHRDLTKGITVTVQPGAWFYDFIDVPVGYTNLTITAVDETPTATPLVLGVKLGSPPTLADTNDLMLLNNPVTTPVVGMGNSISLGPPLTPGRYFVGIFNPDTVAHTVFIIATLGFSPAAIETVDFPSSGPVPLLDDAVTYDSIFVPRTDIIQDFNVGLRVDHPRISDLVFHLISPDGTRYLLMENRGATSTNGAGATTTAMKTVTFPNFSSLVGLSTNGTAAVISGGVLRLTPAAGGQEGSVWLQQKQHCTGGFDTTFHFRIPGPYGIGPGCGSAVGGDGINFSVQNNSPTSLNFSGIGGGLVNSVNVFFNTFRNWPGCTDPVNCDASDNSVGVAVNSAYVAQADLTPLGINMKDGNVHQGHITYNGTGITVWVDNVMVLTNVPMPGLVPGVDSSGNGWVGLDALCGCAYENHDILDWSFSSLDSVTSYLTFTENTNLTTTPIKFAPPPFVPNTSAGVGVTNGFEGLTATNYFAGQTFGPWTVVSNQVSVVTDPTNAYEGSNFLALASGVISNTLPTVAGQTYTLTFAYRGPGIAGWWRGENNANDAIYGNNGTVQNISYAAGEVGQAFVFFGNFSGSQVSVPDQPVFELTNSLSIEGWIYPAGSVAMSGEILWRGDCRAGYDPYFLQMNGDNTLGFIIEDASGAATIINTPAPLANNQWYHVAATLDGNTGAMSIYTNGVLAAQTITSMRPFGALIPSEDPTIGIGNVGTSCWDPISFNGDIDEISLYSRALSASEVKAIYNAGNAGKFDPGVFNTSPAQSLAEAAINVNGGNSTILNGNNANWLIETITFTATQNGTSLQITGLEPGMLLDDFTLTAKPGNLYYLPEESIAALNGTSAYGWWALEIQDDRAGAGLTNTLVSWQLGFTFANTNFTPGPPLLTGGQPLTNTVCSNSITWYQVNVPADASAATNILLFATAPVNVWYSANNPPTTNNPGDVVLIPNSTGPASAVLTATTTPALVPGGTYYLGVQDTSGSCTTYGIEVDFDIPPSILINGQPQTNTVTAGTIDYYSVTVPTNADFATNLLLFATGPLNVWFNQTNQPVGAGPPDYALLSGSTGGIGNPILGTSTSPPLVPGQTYFLGVQNTGASSVTYGIEVNFHLLPPPVASNSVSWTQINVPTNADFATNILVFATAPVDVWWSTNNPPTITNANDVDMIPGATNGSYLLGTNSTPAFMVPGGSYWLGVQNTNGFAVRYDVQVNFHLLSGLPGIITLTNGVPYANANAGTSNSVDYYLYTVSTNAARVQFEVDNPSGDVTLVARYGLPLPALTNFDYRSQNPYTNGELIVVLTNSTPVALQPGNWYLAVVNISGAPVTYTVMATEWAVTGRPFQIISTQYTPPSGTNSGDLCITWNSLPGAYYYVQGATDLVTTNWVAVSPTIRATTNTTTYCVTLPSPFHFFRVAEGLALNIYAPPPMLFITPTNSFYLLQWRGPATFSYQVQWTGSLAPTVTWNTVAGAITSTNGQFSFLEDGSLTAPLGPTRFYRLLVSP